MPNVGCRAPEDSVEDPDAACPDGELRGCVLVPPVDLSDIGRFAVLQDPVGAVFQVLAGKPKTSAPER